HEPGWIAERLRIPRAEVERCFRFLVDTRQIVLVDERYEAEPLAVNVPVTNTQAGRQLRAHWTGVAQERIVSGGPGQFSYNVFAISRLDFERIRELHLKYYRSLRSIVEVSRKAERVAVANVQLFALDGWLDEPDEA